MTMVEVKIAELKAKLSEHLRRVRDGGSVVVLDRDRPVARIVPYRDVGALGLIVRRPRTPGCLREVRRPPKFNLAIDAVELLLEERRAER